MNKQQTPSDPLPRLVVFDPSSSWEHFNLQPSLPENKIIHLGANGSSCEAIRIETGEVPTADCYLAVLPKAGFDERQKRILAAALPRNAPRLYTAFIDKNLLTKLPRNYGFDDLFREVIENYSKPLVMIPHGDDEELAKQMLDCCLATTDAACALHNCTRILHSQMAAAWNVLGCINPTANTMNDVLSIKVSTEKSKYLLTEIAQGRQLRQQSQNTITLSQRKWKGLSDRTRGRCRAKADGRKYFSFGSEDLVKGLSAYYCEVDSLLDADWGAPPFHELQSWAINLRDTLVSPAVTIPVVGVFSCGKTTLLNHLLGSLGKGVLLRTSPTHNTSLLSRFSLKEANEPNHVKLRWRDNFSLSLLTFRNPHTSPVLAPVAGTITRIDQIPEGRLLRIRPKTGGKDVNVLIDDSKSTLPHVRRGAIVKKLSALTVGTSDEAITKRLEKQEPGLRLVAKPTAAARFLRFMTEKKIKNILFRVTWRRFVHAHKHLIKVEEEEIRLDDQLGPLIIKHIETISNNGEESIEIPRFQRIKTPEKRFPVEIKVYLDLNPDNCIPTEHELENDTDWDWFQGPLELSSSKSGRTRGFAESAEAEWLVECADIFLDLDLFRHVSLIDTPGLNSISEHHDRATEECIQSGQAFIIMVKLGRDTYGHATERLVQMVINSLSSQQPQERSENRLFFVLNWDRSKVGARNEEQAKKSADSFCERMGHYLSDKKPKTYVVDLAPASMDSTQKPKTLFGYPSLADLKRDLGSLIAVQGLGNRFRMISKDLQSTWLRLEDDHDRQEHNLSETASTKDLERLNQMIEDFRKGGNRRIELEDIISDHINELNEQPGMMHRELSRDYSEIADFEQALDLGSNAINRYNRTRANLKLAIEEEINSRIKSAIARFISSAPKISLNSTSIEKLPRMTPNTYSNEIEEIIANWPGFWRRAFHAAKNFQFYANTRREEIKRKYFSATLLQRIEDRTRVIENESKKKTRKLCDDILNKLEKIKEVQEADIDAKISKRLELEKEAMSLKNFQPCVVRMTKLLEQVIKEITISSAKTATGDQE